MSTNETAKLYKPTAAELQAGLGVIRAVAETVKDLGRAPRGVLYSALMSHGVQFSAYQTIERILLSGGLVKVDGDCLVWQAQ